jgi:epoxyqueuosine reductase
MDSLEIRLKRQAQALGFALTGIAAAGPADDFDRLHDWLARGYAGEMGYMHRHAEARRHPASILPDVRSVVMAAMNYGSQPAEADTERMRGQVARYARGADYHDVLRERLKQLLTWVQAERPGCRGRAVVDTAPLLERDFARRAGLGWIGKNTMLLNKRQGSYFFLGALLLDVELQADPPHQANHCGTCRACLDACPTQAFTGPGWLDARRCISYLTIELRGSVPEALRPGLGEWVFGCDVCQEVCPWNRHAPADAEPALQQRAELAELDLVEVLGLSEEQFEERFGATALARPRRGGLLRNAAHVLGNQGDSAALPALRRARKDADPLVREAAEWAITQIEKQTLEKETGVTSLGGSQ